MDFETRMPYIHRFKPARFSQRSTEELNDNRDYWGPWLFLQLVYHTNLCLLNHPLLLSLRLRNFQSVIPEIFLQHTSDLISSHASWIIHIIEMLDTKSFRVTDPFLGYCVAIVATIYLQESFVDDMEIRREKERSFGICLSFVRGLGEQWPHVSRIVCLLQHDFYSWLTQFNNLGGETPKTQRNCFGYLYIIRQQRYSASNAKSWLAHRSRPILGDLGVFICERGSWFCEITFWT